jgi:hypothetical protein
MQIDSYKAMSNDNVQSSKYIPLYLKEKRKFIKKISPKLKMVIESNQGISSIS